MLTIPALITLLSLIAFIVAAFGPADWYPRNDRNRMIALGLALFVLAGII